MEEEGESQQATTSLPGASQCNLTSVADQPMISKQQAASLKAVGRTHANYQHASATHPKQKPPQCDRHLHYTNEAAIASGYGM